MISRLFAGRSSLSRLHQTVQRNIIQHHRQTIRHESSKPHTAPSGSTSSSSSRNSSTIANSAGAARSSTTSQPASIAGPSWIWLDAIRIPFRGYGNMQKRSPYLVQFESALVIYFLGDLSAQTVQSGAFSEAAYEPMRGLRAMLIGGIMCIPSYKWFLWLGRNFNYSSHVLSLAVKIGISQCLFTPCFNTYFFGMQSLLTGSTMQEAVDRVARTVPISWMNSWKVWPAVTAFLFTFVAPHNRSVCAGVVAIFWQTYLSWLNRAAELAEREKTQGKIAA